MHMHTTVSDGPMTPEEVKAAYKERGYSIVAFTDHEVIVDHKVPRLFCGVICFWGRRGTS